ncbi:ABC transporter ATP-binding protein [Streptomyces cellulosae]|uniref:ABC transporter ATP-binding protein n=1 Tax=Streptomyces cellulosae TaxID=1968 RepID=UPI0006923A8C|nr:ABC transporter ATP-binding protein [Streptomyces cellulosae]
MTTPRLSVKDLHVQFPVRSGHRKQTLRAVDGVSVDLKPSEILGIVGESGCGKSTLARVIAGLTEPAHGSVELDGRPLPPRRTVQEQRAIQMVFQDPGASLNPRLTVGAVLTELLHRHGIVDRARERERAEDLLRRVGLPARAYDARPRQLSGGQRQRVGIARALAVEPRLIVADEAVAALDVSVQAAILNLFADLRVSLALSMVFISHDLSAVQAICDRVAVMYLGKIVEVGSVDELFSAPGHPYTRALLAASPSLEETAAVAPPLTGEPPSPLRVPNGCRFHPRCPLAVEKCHIAEPQWEMQGEHRTACHRAWEVDDVTAAGARHPRGIALNP